MHGTIVKITCRMFSWRVGGGRRHRSSHFHWDHFCITRVRVSVSAREKYLNNGSLKKM